MTTHPADHPRPALAVDVAIVAVIAGALQTLLVRRGEAPFAGHWSLPGGFVRIDETIEAAALRVLRDKADVTRVHVEQLYTFGAVSRDPRMRVVSVGHIALLPPDRFAAIATGGDVAQARVALPASGSAVALSPGGDPLPLAFDHAEILAATVQRLGGKLDWSDVGFALLPPEFTLRQLQDVHEALAGRSLNKPAFRRRMIDRGWLEPTGRREAEASHRPAELYRHRPT
ncbi:NUDIX hydrolase [Sphingomonas profundi]|uniref:NUDIX hydrolase n=1 Tax=Alterirhizorhabdus profundi TaxID=2681549 RepID=UPI0012E761B8|nr:NUDIX domain-containing protein [Sphingomonas profundi]